MQKSKKGLDILLLLPQRGCIPNFRKFGSSDLEKMRYKRTDERTDGTEIIGPSGKIPGTNENFRKLAFKSAHPYYVQGVEYPLPPYVTHICKILMKMIRMFIFA